MPRLGRRKRSGTNLPHRYCVERSRCDDPVRGFVVPPCVEPGQPVIAAADAMASAFFHDSPAAALALGDGGAEQRWLTGAALGALGRFGAAAAVLVPLAQSNPLAEPNQPTTADPIGSLAWSTLASHQRQLGRHTEALEYDQRAAATAPASHFGARFDAALGLTADAVGLGHVAEAATRLIGVEALAGAHPLDADWRTRVRRGWVATEIALLRGDPTTAVDLAEEALVTAVAAAAPRHVAKCTLFLGASRYVRYRDVGGGLTPVRTMLADASSAATALDALPLLWVAESLLADVAVLAGEPAVTVATHRARAAAAVSAIAVDLPAGQRGDWLARPDLAALLAGAAPPGR